MARPVKLYNHAVAPNPRRVRIFAAEMGIELSLDEVCRYLEGLHPEPNVLGRDLREQAEIERWNRRMELELFAAIGRTIQNRPAGTS